MRAEISLRQRLAQRLILSPELRLELSQRAVLQCLALSEKPGVVAPDRVRCFEIKGGKKFVSKQVEMEDMADPYAEALNQELFKERGFHAPDLAGVLESNGICFIITEFDDRCANIASLMLNPDIHREFLKHSRLCLDDAIFNRLMNGRSNDEQLKILSKLYKGVSDSVRKGGLGRAFNESFAHKDIERTIEIQNRVVLLGKPLLGLVDNELFESEIEPFLRHALVWKLGRELALLHDAGIDKKDFSPRNLMLKFVSDEMEIVHTGFRNVDFLDESLNRKQRKAALLRAREAFGLIQPNCAERYMKVFMAGYFDKAGSHFRVSPIEVQAGVREGVVDRLKRVFASDKRLLCVLSGHSDEAAAPPPPSNLKAFFEEVVLRFSDEELNARSVFGAWMKIIEKHFELTEPTIKEARAQKVILYLYNHLADFGYAALVNIEQAQDESIRMHLATASRIVAPVFDKYGIPSLREAIALFSRCVVLRLYRQHLSVASDKLSEILNENFSQFGIRMVPRSIRKYLKQLRDDGKVARINAVGHRRVKSCFDRLISQGDHVSAEAVAGELRMDADDIRPLIVLLQERCFESILREGGDFDEWMIALEICIEKALEIQRRVEDSLRGQQREAEIRSTADAGVREGDTVVLSNTALHSQNDACSDLEDGGRVSTHDSGVLEDRHHARESAGDGVVESDDQIERMNDVEARTHIRRRIAEAALDGGEMVFSSQLASEIGYAEEVVHRFISDLIEEGDLMSRRDEVRSVIMRNPGVDDRGIADRTGLSMDQIHLIVWQDLYAGSLSSGRRGGRE